MYVVSGKRGKMCVIDFKLVFVLFLIGWKRSMCIKSLLCRVEIVLLFKIGFEL